MNTPPDHDLLLAGHVLATLPMDLDKRLELLGAIHARLKKDHPVKGDIFRAMNAVREHMRAIEQAQLKFADLLKAPRSHDGDGDGNGDHNGGQAK